MKELLLLIMSVSFSLICQATLHVNMFPNPVQITLSPGNSWVSWGSDSVGPAVNDFLFVIAANVDTQAFCFVESGAGGCTFAVDSNTWNAKAFSCRDIIPINTSWKQPATLAQQIGDANFDGQGIRYLAFRKEVTGGYKYGWYKVDCSDDGESLTIYGYAFDDRVDSFPTILMGEGDCVSGIAEVEAFNPIIMCYQDKIDVTYPEPLELRLYDLQGRLLKVFQFKGGEAAYDFSNLDRSMYILEFTNERLKKSMKIEL